MNMQLVNSLVQIIESLTLEERTLLFERLSSKPIQVTARVCGGQPRIRNAHPRMDIGCFLKARGRRRGITAKLSHPQQE